MIFSNRKAHACLCAIALTLSLSACKKTSTAEVAGMDRELMGNAAEADPALTGALQDQIMVDPDLVGQSNASGARPRGTPRQAPIPPVLAGGGTAPAPRGTLRAPAPKPGAAHGNVTLGELAQIQAARAGGASARDCIKNVRYSTAWAAKLPAALPVYPDGRVLEAAGNDAPGCGLRVVSFASAAPMQQLIDWYYTQAVHSGYSAEHQANAGEHVLGGVRKGSDAAYYIIFNTRPGGGTDVDLIAKSGV